MCYNYRSLGFGDIMSKTKIKTMLNNKTENRIFSNEVLGIKTNNKIKYIDNDVSVNIDMYDHKLTIERKNDDYHIILTFSDSEKTSGIYNINQLGSLKLEIDTNSLLIDTNKIEISYTLVIEEEKVEFYFYLEMEDLI